MISAPTENGKRAMTMPEYPEYIEREALMSRIKEIHCAECDSYNGVRCRACWVDDTLDYIDSEPAADVSPVRHARWKSYGKNLGECSECGEIVSVRSNYCPNCGCLMDGGAD